MRIKLITNKFIINCLFIFVIKLKIHNMKNSPIDEVIVAALNFSNLVLLDQKLDKLIILSISKT